MLISLITIFLLLATVGIHYWCFIMLMMSKPLFSALMYEAVIFFLSFILWSMLVTFLGVPATATILALIGSCLICTMAALIGFFTATSC